MRPKTNRLLMLLIGAALAGCANQTERSSSGAGSGTEGTQVEVERVGGTSNVVTQEELERRAAAKAAAEAQAAPPEPAPQPAAEPEAEPEYEPEPVQYVDRPLEEPAVQAAAVAGAGAAAAEAADPVTTSAADEALPDFPITKYEIEEGPTEQEEEATEQLAEEEAAPEEEVVSEATEPEEAVATVAAEPEPEPEPAAEEPAPAEDLTAQSPAEEQPAPEAPVSEPAPAEPVQQVQAAPTSISVDFEAEPLFNFDKANVRADQRKLLDDFVAGLQDVEYDEIVVVGHADRIGSEAYNQKLSERRANAVRAYLIRQGVPAAKVRAEGRGESESVVGDNCSAERGKSLIACLQPDRRVDVSVSGSKSN